MAHTDPVARPDERFARRSDPGRAAGRRSFAWQFGQFALAGAVALVLVGIATSVASRRIGEREAIAAVRTTTVIRAQGVVTPALSDGLLAGDPQAIERLDAVVRRDVLDDDLVRVKLWTADGRIVYSDEERLLDTTWELGDDELTAMETGRIVAEVSDLSEPENRFERAQGKLLEVYLPLRAPSGEVLLFEAYHRYQLVRDNGDRLWREFAPISIGALVVLQLVTLPLAWSLARRLRQRQQEREALLRRSLEASDVERRQIASDLHDGVVQDLSGVAFALSAAGRRAPDPDADSRLLDESAVTVRGSIRALRSLVVDIYPPDFDEVTLTSALTDLAARASESGVSARVDTDGLDDPLPDEVARLVYRVAQEGLRNALEHAEASSVVIRAAARGRSASIEVTDDGRGLDPEVAGQRQAAGHVGLVALRGLIHDAGGTLELESRPGAGTTLRAEVPLP